MKLTLVRFAYTRDVTLGWLLTDSLTIATLEEPWNENPDGPGGQPRTASRRESCVPDGVYRLVPHDGTKKQGVWALVNPALGVYHNQIPPGQKHGRTAILIHAGNTVYDTEGCIVVGLNHKRFDDLDHVIDSRSALERLRTLLGRQTHELEIRPIAGTSEVSFNGREGIRRP